MNNDGKCVGEFVDESELDHLEYLWDSIRPKRVARQISRRLNCVLEN